MLPLLRMVEVQRHCGGGIVFIHGRFREELGVRESKLGFQ